MPTLAEIAVLVGAVAPSDSARSVTGVATLEEAGAGDLAVVANEKFFRQLADTRAIAVLTPKGLKLPPGAPPALIVDNADLAMAKVVGLFAPPVPRPPKGVDRDARVAADAQLADGVAVGPFVWIGSRAVIGAGTVLHPGVHVGDECVIGEHCELFPNVVLRERVTLGNRVVIHAGSVVGSDGFGYRWDGARHAKIPQIGSVIIEDDVEIGSCTCIDRAKFSVTRIGRGSKIDNLVQIAHNVTLGPHCIMCGQAGVAGSSHLGAGAIMGGQSATRDHVNIGDGVMVAATSGVADDVPANTIVSGIPAMPHRQTLREQAALRRLPDILVQFRKMADRVKELERQLGNQSPSDTAE